MANKVRVRARIEHRDATQNIERTIGEVYTMDEARARLKAGQGFVDLIDRDGRTLAPDAPELDVVEEGDDPVTTVPDKPSTVITFDEGPAPVARPGTKAKTAAKKSAAKKTSEK